MNAASQAVTPELASKIAHLAVLFRAEYPDSQIDLSPWLTDAKTQSQLDPYSIDLSFYVPQWNRALACRCVLMQVSFSEDLLLPTSRLIIIQASGYHCTQRQWQFSTQDWAFAGLSIPTSAHQERFRYVISRIFEFFQYPNQVNLHE
ncbi:MAG: hypothetical protein AAFW75_16240 [Cyanobacteria bacterium J06636_16]